MSVYLSKGNRKIYKSHVFNLPVRITCPCATKMCKAACYSKPQESLYPQVKPCRMRNLEASKQKDFVQFMIKTLNESKIKRVRIHESGDFYNQTYLNKWVQIIANCPDTKFWTYSKSYKLDFRSASLLKNFRLRISVDATSDKAAWTQPIPLAILRSEELPGVFTCPASKEAGHKIRCMKDCFFCADKPHAVLFLPHGTYKNKVHAFELEVTNG